MPALGGMLYGPRVDSDCMVRWTEMEFWATASHALWKHARETMVIEVGQDILTGLDRAGAAFEEALHRKTSDLSVVSPRLAEAMAYSLHAGGKRIRPCLVRWCCELCGGRWEDAIPPAIAIECVHTFSLIHDDLPAIDDDEFRRGKLTNHRVFGEATAVLAGDALLAFAFETLADGVSETAVAAAMMGELARATGRMIGGEQADLEGESQPPDVQLVREIHAAKTARLIESACRLGGIAAAADEGRMRALSEYGHALGLAFQVADDLLDITGTLESLGKKAGKDAEAGKQTYPRAVGDEASRDIAQDLVRKAVSALEPFESSASKLEALARFAVERTS